MDGPDFDVFPAFKHRSLVPRSSRTLLRLAQEVKPLQLDAGSENFTRRHGGLAVSKTEFISVHDSKIIKRTESLRGTEYCSRELQTRHIS